MRMLDKILEKLLNEGDEAGIRSLVKVYRDVEKGIDPDPIDIFTALDLMKEYFQDYIRWYDRRRMSREERMRVSHITPIFRKRLGEIHSALQSKNPKEQLVVLDTAVGQWHIDLPVIRHIFMGIKTGSTELEQELEDLLTEVENILNRLGKEPRKHEKDLLKKKD